MESANSGSMQSSSGGDDNQEFDSRGESISSFLNPSNFGSISSAPQPPFLPHQNPNFFDPHGAQYKINNDLIWSSTGSLRSDQQNYPNFVNTSRTAQSTAVPSSSDGPRAQPNVIKNPKKRTRASRRAPTTVLTTDTTNFRQMVQEFTGIPAAPFSNSPYSRRLDLFSAASAFRPDALGPLYPLRPAAHKIQQPPFSSHSTLLNSTMIDSVVPTTTTIGASASNNPNNYQLYHHSISQQPSLQLGANATMNYGNLSGFLSGETQSGAAVRNNNDGVEENLVGFDGSNINSGGSENMSGYNLNLAEKGMENVGGSSGADGTTVASWICPSD